MVKQFDTTNNSKNSIPDNINLNNLDSNGYTHSADFHSGGETEIVQPINNSPAYALSQKSGSEHQTLTWWKRLSLGSKVTALAVAVGVLPVFGVGVISLVVTNQAGQEQTITDKQTKILKVSNIVDSFLSERSEDIRALATIPIFSDAELQGQVTERIKQQTLNQYLEIYQVYDSIALFDLQGNVIVQSNGSNLPNNNDFDYFQEVLKTDRPVISQQQATESPSKVDLYSAAPVKDSVTGKTIAIIRARMPASVLSELLKNSAANDDSSYSLVNESGNILATADKELQGKQINKEFPELERLRKEVSAETFVTSSKNSLAPASLTEDILAVYTPLNNSNITSSLNWGVILTSNTKQSLAAKGNLVQILLLGILVTAALVGVVATLLTRRLIKPILSTTNVLKQLAQGNLNTRLNVEGEDELAVLGSNLNLMADHLQTVLEDQKASLERAQLFADVATSAAREEDRAYVFKRAVEGAKRRLGADRVVVYSFEPDFSGTIIAEAVDPGWPRALADRITDPCISGKLLDEYRKGRIVPTSDVRATNYSQEHLQLLKRLEVKANLVVPIIAGDSLLGLIIAHQCSRTRVWEQREIDFLERLAAQVGLSLTSVSLVTQKAAEVERAHQLNEITSHIRKSLKIEDIYNAAVKGTRETLKTDRTIVYLFDENWQGTVVAESVGRDWPASLGMNIADSCFAEGYVEKYRRGRIKAVENIYKAGLTECYLGQLEPLKVKANLVAPILSGDRLHGLLVTHQCSSTRPWQESEISFFKQIAIQVGFAIDQGYAIEQQEQARITAETVSQEQRQQKEELQLQLLELLSDVEGAARGDLTVRADVTAGEIGTVADFFNAVIESLRGIVTQVKKAATQVNTSLGENEGAIRQLSEEALKQAEETTSTLDSLQFMTLSIQDVAENARQAAVVARQASSNAEAGGIAMDRSVQNILNLRETVSETAKKVKRLGESSQQISKVVSLINQIALQTNLLAINAGIEAARAGEEGQGFAVVAEEVGELAARSAAATQEIEQIVDNIQKETAEVVQAMELGTSQVVEGTHLVEDAKHSLSKILEVSHQIDYLVQSISSATVSQVETSQAVTELMKEIAKVSERASDSTRLISTSIKETVEIAQELQASVGTFNVGVD
ncbi:methyl-accepting chemotaxis protein [Lyngbya aestuarii]|uniref:methyl-accepting chemotaxis protein n=1 Tax=Lyngbya aestuarii TaxID=118322 RepID=UPI00403DD9CC